MSSFFLVKGFIYFLAGIYRVNVQESFITRLRIKNLKGLNSVAYKYFVRSDIGRIQNTLTGEVERVARAFTFYFRSFQNGIMILIYMTFAFLVDAQFAILVSIGGVLANFFYKYLYNYTKTSSRQLTADVNVFQSLIIQNVSNYKYLKATNSLDKYATKLLDYIKKIEISNKALGKLDALQLAIREPILIILVVSIIYIQTTVLGSSLAPILISLLFFYRALNYLMQMQMDWNRFLEVTGSVENMTAFEKEMKVNQEYSGVRKIVDSISTLELSEVSFNYNSTTVLKDINLKINKNETLGFVGESGSGKTTLVNILAGLLTVEMGEYVINGVNSKEMNLKYLQNKLGYITQDSVIFNDTIFNNVTFWAEKNETNLNKFLEVIKKASLLDYLESLPQKENEMLGNNGINLSGGQKQRISIARELYKDVEILILDEATSSLDSEAEKAIQLNIEQLKGNYTLLIIAHRMATIKNANRIVVMKSGEITEIGTFSELIRESTYFKKIVQLQDI
jgi:subfamily B ATP-binding cassette protein MsbA